MLEHPLASIRSGARGFTIVELLVVVTIIVVLLALLVPSMESAFMLARNARCAAQQHSLLHLFTMYAMDNSGVYQNGARSDGTEHIPWTPYAVARYVESTTGNNRGSVDAAAPQTPAAPQLLMDPALGDYAGYFAPGYAVIIGYSYLAGHPYVTNANDGVGGLAYWESPISVNNPGSGDMIACHAYWFLGDNWVRLNHGPGGGPYGNAENVFTGRAAPGKSNDPLDMGLTGLNLGRSDGSVTWKQPGDTTKYTTAAGVNWADPSWPARW